MANYTNITVSKDLLTFFKQADQYGQKKVLGNRIYNTVKYILPLEFGHSKKQAPKGMVRIRLNEIQRDFLERLNEDFRAGKFIVNLDKHLNDTGFYGMWLIGFTTPIDTGKARGGWNVKQVDGKIKSFELGWTPPSWAPTAINPKSPWYAGGAG